MKSLQNEETDTRLSLPSRLNVALAFFAFIAIGANDGAVGVLLPSLRTHYNVDNATVGLIFLASTLGYFIASFTSGLLVEKLGHKRFLMLGTTLFLLSAATLSFMPPFVGVLIVMLILGMGVAMLDAGLNAYIALFPNNTSLLNYLHAFYGVGAWLGPLVASTILVLNLGWNGVYKVWIAVALLLLLGLGIIFHERTTAAQRQSEKSEGNVLLMTLKLRVVWFGALFLLFYVGTEVSLGSWSYSLLTVDRHGSTLISGWTVSGYWFGLTLGRLLLGSVARRIGDKRLIQLCLLGVVAGLLLVWLVPLPAISAVGLFFVGFCLGPLFPTTIALMSKLVSSRIVAGAVGFMASLGSMGAALFPWLAGNLAQHIGLWSLLPYVIGLTAVMLCLWIALQSQSNTTEP
jgi:fucose permease